MLMQAPTTGAGQVEEVRHGNSTQPDTVEGVPGMDLSTAEANMRATQQEQLLFDEMFGLIDVIPETQEGLERQHQTSG